MDIGIPELLIIAVIIVLLFGVGRIGKVGGELGKGIREFRSAIKDNERAETAQATPATASATAGESKPAA